MCNLNSHLQAFVSRRSQANSLRTVPLPGSTPPHKRRKKSTSMASGLSPDSLQAYSTASFDTVSLRWTIPLPTEHELERWRRSEDDLFGEDGDELDLSEGDEGLTEDEQMNEEPAAQDTAPDSAEAAERRRRREARLKRRRSARPPGEMKALDVKAQWTALDRDDLGGVASGSSETSTETLSVREAGATFTTTEHGRLIIELVRSKPDFKRPRLMDGDVHALHSERAFVEQKERRKDLERLFLQPTKEDLGSWSFDQALQRIAQKVWDEECEEIAGS